MLTENALAALENLRTMPERLRVVVAGALKVGALAALGKTQRERFSGEGPFPVSDRRLGIVTGRLRGSFLLSEPASDADGVSSVISTSVVYFARHEFGWSGQEYVKAHTRLIRRELETGRVLKAGRSARKGKTTAVGMVDVKAHIRWGMSAERRPLRTGLDAHLTREFFAELERRLA